jgi:regulator of sigma E protease
VGYVAPESPAAKAGFHAGDVIESVNGKAVTHWEGVENSVYSEALTGNLLLNIKRGGEPMTITMTQPLASAILEDRFGLYPTGMAAYVTTIESGKPAERTGLKPGDMIVSVNGEAISFQSLQETVKRSSGKEVAIRWKRGEVVQDSRITPTPDGKIGVGFSPVYTGPVEQVHYSLLAALPEGVSDAWNMSWMNLKSIYQILVGHVSFSKSVAGPIMIAKMATRSAEVGIMSFLGFMALLSMNLAILNLFPFPALDGGHAVFLVYEGIFRREIPAKVKIAIQQVGFVLLLVFMAFVLYNDIIRF